MQSETEISVEKSRGFLILQSNSEFLTVVRKSIGGDAGKNLCLAADHLKKGSQIKIDYENFAQCFIQVAYLIYTSKYYGLNPQILSDFIRVEDNIGYAGDRRFSIVIFYTLSDTPRDNSNYCSIVVAIYNYLKQFYELYEKNIKENAMDADHKTAIKNFMVQYAVIEARLTQLDEMQRQNYFYFLLEETDLFRDNSMLLKIKNSSILDYIKTRFPKFKHFKQQDQKQVKQYNSERRKIKSNIEQLKNREKQIQKNLISFFEQLQKTNPQKFKLKLQPDQNYRTKFIFTSYDIPIDSFQSRINKILPIQEHIMQMEGQAIVRQKLPFCQYQIQYHSERNIICVKLVISTIACSPEIIDFIMFQANAITFQSPNISLEFVEDRADKGSMRKYLAFRGASCFNTKEPILEKILILMDLTTIAGKICEPELLPMRKSFMVDKDTYKLSLINQKLNHYSKLFLKCAKKVYSE